MKIKSVLVGFLSLYFSSLSSAGGSDIIYGGEPLVEAFQNYQHQVITELSAVPEALLPAPQFLPSYKSKAEKTLVRVSNAPLLKGSDEYMFLNYPYSQPPQIVISRGLLNKNPLTAEKYKKFVLHETLHLLGYDDSKYAYSTRLARFMDFFRTPLKPYSLVQTTVTPPSPEAVQAALWVLSNLSEAISPRTLSSDEDLASLVAFAGRSPVLFRVEKTQQALIINSIAVFLNLNTYFSTYSILNANQYDCTLAELEKYREVIPRFSESIHNLSLKGYRKPPAPFSKECPLPL